MDQVSLGGIEITADAADPWVVAAVNTLRETPGEPACDPHHDEPPEQAEVLLTLERTGDQVSVGGRIEIVMLRGCDRCGASVRMALRSNIRMQYNPPGDLLADADHGLDQGELDVGWHDGQAMDLGAILMEQLALQAPERVRCGDPGAVPVDPDVLCKLPEGVTAEGAAEGAAAGPKRANPFAGLQLPD
jgi:uncharacterized metal-binding protein YceD (DUF177 family)